MFLLLEEDTYRPLMPMDQMLLMKEFEAVHKIWGARGIYFAVLYGWKGSPFADEEEKAREANVLERISNPNWYSDTFPYKFIREGSSKLSSFKGEIMRAITRINDKYPVPELEDYDYYENRIRQTKKALGEIKVKAGDAAAMKKAADTESTYNKNIREMRNYQQEAENALTSKYRQKKHLSLNDLIALHR